MTAELNKTSEQFFGPSDINHSSSITATEAAQHQLLKGKESFEQRLAAQIGSDAASQFQADQFNEKGLLGELTDFNQLDRKKLQHTPQKFGGEGAQNIVRNTDDAKATQDKIQDAFKATGIEESHGYLSQTSDTSSPPGSAARITAGQPLGGLLNFPQAISHTGKLNIPDPSSREQPAIARARQYLTDAVEPSPKVTPDSSKIQLRSLAIISDLMWQAANRRNVSPVKVALRGLETGMSLVVEITDVNLRGKQKTRDEILSLVALHGLGNYELSINGKQFKNSIKSLGKA